MKKILLVVLVLFTLSFPVCSRSTPSTPPPPVVQPPPVVTPPSPPPQESPKEEPKPKGFTSADLDKFLAEVKITGEQLALVDPRYMDEVVRVIAEARKQEVPGYLVGVRCGEKPASVSFFRLFIGFKTTDKGWKYLAPYSGGQEFPLEVGKDLSQLNQNLPKDLPLPRGYFHTIQRIYHYEPIEGLKDHPTSADVKKVIEELNRELPPQIFAGPSTQDCFYELYQVIQKKGLKIQPVVIFFGQKKEALARFPLVCNGCQITDKGWIYISPLINPVRVEEMGVEEFKKSWEEGWIFKILEMWQIP